MSTANPPCSSRTRVFANGPLRRGSLLSESSHSDEAGSRDGSTIFPLTLLLSNFLSVRSQGARTETHVVFLHDIRRSFKFSGKWLTGVQAIRSLFLQDARLCDCPRVIFGVACE